MIVCKIYANCKSIVYKIKENYKNTPMFLFGIYPNLTNNFLQQLVKLTSALYRVLYS